MKKSDLQILERIFAREIEGSLYQPNRVSAALLRLESEGYIKQVEWTEGRPPLHVKGWVLTLLGNFTYCMSCPEEDEP